MITKPRVTMRLFWEGQDQDYDKQDRKRYTKIRRVVNKVPKKDFRTLFVKNKNYWFYKGFCFGRDIKEVLTESEFEIVIGVIDNIKCGYYNWRNKNEIQTKN